MKSTSWSHDHIYFLPLIKFYLGCPLVKKGRADHSAKSGHEDERAYQFVLSNAKEILG